MNKSEVLSDEVAEEELERIEQFYNVEVKKNSKDDEEAKGQADSRKRLLVALKRGRFSMDDDGKFVMILSAPVVLENGETISSITCSEPTFADIKALERYTSSQSITKTVHMYSRLTNLPIGVVERIGARDFALLGLLSGFFI